MTRCRAVGSGLLTILLACLGCSAPGASVSPSPVPPATVQPATVLPAPVPPAEALTCTYALQPTSLAVEHAGGVGTATVTAGTGCTWTAVSNASFITVKSGASGNGDGTVSFDVKANVGSVRTGTLTIAGQLLTVTQSDTSSCTYSLSPTSWFHSLPYAFGTSATVTTAVGCPWTATVNVPWISILSSPGSGSAGIGSGMVFLHVPANSGDVRTGVLTVAGQTFTVTQVANCGTSAEPKSAVFDASGDSGSATVTLTYPSCDWRVGSSVSWITFSGPRERTGSGTVSFAVAPNTTGAERSGFLTFSNARQVEGGASSVFIRQSGQ